MLSHCIIVGNGDMKADEGMVNAWSAADLRIAADGGARNARRFLRLPPHVIIGDMDSIDAETGDWLASSHVERVQYPQAKDKTDLELAIDLARARGASEIRIFGALGGRVDQYIANILLLVQSSCIMEDASFEIRALKADTKPAESDISGAIGDTVSLLPLSDTVEGIATAGLVYPLRDEALARGTTRGVSNELSAPIGQVAIRKGQLLIIRLKKR